MAFIPRFPGLALALMLFSSSLTAQHTMLLRDPSIGRQSIVFVYGDDLWVTGTEGGSAKRLTSAVGAEFSPRISPDGQWVAFSGEYDGNLEVYIVGIDGGDPKRLTWHPGGDIVQGWTADSKKIIFTSMRDGYPTADEKFFTVALTGGKADPLSLPFGNTGSLSADGLYMAYQPFQMWDPEWRNYKGGQATPIWVSNMKSFETIRTVQRQGERHMKPVWDGKMVYYLSEADNACNIWSFDPATKVQKQVSFHSDFDVKNLSAYNGVLVYEQGGRLHKLDIASGKTNPLQIQVNGDLNWGRPRWNDVKSSSLINASLSPTGKRALFETRGEVFSVPKEFGDKRNLTNSPGVADRNPIWSPDGQNIAWFSDSSGEYVLMVGDQMGMGVPRAYKMPNQKFYYTPVWSPNGKYIAYTDTDYNLWYVDLASGKTTLVATDRLAHPNRTINPAWSPDSKWIAFVQIQPNQFKAVKVYNLETGVSHALTDGLSDAVSPQWDASGKYLYLLASTDYALATGWLDMSSYNYPVTRVLYIVVLDKETANPLKPKSDDEEVKAEEPKPVEASRKKKRKDTADAVVAKVAEVRVRIDMEDIAQRIIATQLAVGEYIDLVAGPEGEVFVMEVKQNQPLGTLHKYSIKEQKASEFLKGISYAITSFDRKSLLYQMSGNWFISGTEGESGKPGDGKLPTEGMKVYVDPALEARQIFREGWRLQRDFLYVSNVHGAPWDQVYEWYKPWVQHVKHRSDLAYLMDMVGGEVAVGHSFIWGGDMPKVPQVPVGMLGADFEVDKGMYRIKRIYNGENWNPELRSPLSGPGINVKVGDYLVEVEGRPLKGDMELYSLFEQTAGKQIRIKVNDKPSLEGARTQLVVPVESEWELRSRAWIEDNRRKVTELSGGKLAYVYVPNTGNGGYTYFNRYYFAQQDKQGVVIDERNNGGGSAADYMIDVMNRKLMGYFNNRVEGHTPSTTPMAGIWGPKVMLINQNAGSGGDLLPYMFRKSKIGPLVGTRTWGGLVGIWDTPDFVDGGHMTAPRGGFYDTDGKWAVENEGVAPDIEVLQDPKAMAEGRDVQLERAVAEAMRLLPTQGIELKKEPAPPVRYARPSRQNQ